VSEIRILKENEFDAFVDIVGDAYPAWEITSPEDVERTKKHLLQDHQEEPTVAFYGLFREGELQGGMRFHDYTMNFLGTMMPAGGVGLIAVDLVHKKEHVAKEMVSYFLHHYREQGAPLTLLYPFRPDFYKRMGFGYGNKMSQYRIEPASFPRGPSKAHVRYLTQDDREALAACYTRVMRRTHGMIEKTAHELTRLFRRPQHRFVGYEKEGRIEGYLVFSFEKGEDFLQNDIQVREIIYENREALLELLTFLHTQADQIRHVVLNIEDPYFHHLLSDPRNASRSLIPPVCHESNLQGVGLMVRVIDVPRVFGLLEERDFGGYSGTLRLTVADSFLPENAGSTLVRFTDGHPQVVEGESHDVEIRLEVAEFSSLLAGAVPFRRLHTYDLAEISDEGQVELVDRIFAVREPPVCTTWF
jgi:predicted acetyltransferase